MLSLNVFIVFLIFYFRFQTTFFKIFYFRFFIMTCVCCAVSNPLLLMLIFQPFVGDSYVVKSYNDLFGYFHSVLSLISLTGFVEYEMAAKKKRIHAKDN